jgi:hypothetical protein
LDASANDARDPKTFYMENMESIEGSGVEIAATKLKAAMSKDGYRFTDNPRAAGYYLRLEVKSCNVGEIDDMFYCNACVKVEIMDMKTDKVEGNIDFTGPKTGWKDKRGACVRAFERGVEATWKKMKEDIKMFKQ